MFAVDCQFQVPTVDFRLFCCFIVFGCRCRVFAVDCQFQVPTVDFLVLLFHCFRVSLSGVCC